MASILYKWFFACSLILFCSSATLHPIFVSVTEIEHNAKEKTLEISCKIFTDDFEKTLRQAYKTHIDLLKPADKDAMNKLVNDYVQKHLQVNVDGKTVQLKFIGYEQLEEGISSYYQADNITSVKNIMVTDNILYEYKAEQLNLIHVTVNGSRKSTKLSNPESKASFSF
ncbi:hypothetical protein BH11BAC4_BH11BAC4_26280 [soil metagenome]